ncbi:MAG: MBL fold metallo-hydrolase RNA specificity domain-containing protein [Desulforegulaceae bacterium]|nr:MBL fold metallo-hydrolase RNA specificity domain-containing protein [Desulforegulaceae bacterium]
MSYNYTGVIFKIPFPFTDLSDSKARPAMALSEPDDYGDMAFAFITTKQSRGSEYTMDIPHGVLPFASHLHLDKVFLLNKEIILKEIVRVEATFLEQVLKRLTLKDTKCYYENTHHVFQQQPFVTGKSRVNYAGRVSAIIIAGSGMCNGGRILNHLEFNLDKKENDIFFIGYQAQGTKGSDIVKYSKRSNGYVKINNEKIYIKAKVHNLSGYSAHADKNFLVEWVKSMEQKPKAVKLVHGDTSARNELSGYLKKSGYNIIN